MRNGSKNLCRRRLPWRSPFLSNGGKKFDTKGYCQDPTGKSMVSIQRSLFPLLGRMFW